MMHTKDKLAAALREVGLDHMAALAAEGHYHEFLSSLPLPLITLVTDMGDAARDAEQMKRIAILELRRQVIEGDFDASHEESEAWANSDDGKRTFGDLLGAKW